MCKISKAVGGSVPRPVVTCFVASFVGVLVGIQIHFDQSFRKVDDKGLVRPVHIHLDVIWQGDVTGVVIAEVDFQHGVGPLVHNMHNGGYFLACGTVLCGPALHFMKVEFPIGNGRHFRQRQPHVFAGEPFGLVFRGDIGQPHDVTVLVPAQTLHCVGDENALLRDPKGGGTFIGSGVVDIHPKHNLTFEAEGLGDFPKQKTLVLCHGAKVGHNGA